MKLPSPPDLDKVADILADLSPKPPDDLIEEVKGLLHRHHVLLETVRRATPSGLRKEMKKIMALTEQPGGQLLEIAGVDCSAAALRMLLFAHVNGEPLGATAKRCLQQLAKHPRGPQGLQRYDSFLIFQLVRAFKERGIDVPASFEVQANTILNTNTKVVFRLMRLIWPHVSEEGFRKRWFYRGDIVEEDARARWFGRPCFTIRPPEPTAWSLQISLSMHRHQTSSSRNISPVTFRSMRPF